MTTAVTGIVVLLAYALSHTDHSREQRRGERPESRARRPRFDRMHRPCPLPSCGSFVFGDSEDDLEAAMDRHELSCHSTS